MKEPVKFVGDMDPDELTHSQALAVVDVLLANANVKAFEDADGKRFVAVVSFVESV